MIVQHTSISKRVLFLCFFLAIFLASYGQAEPFSNSPNGEQPVFNNASVPSTSNGFNSNNTNTPFLRAPGGGDQGTGVPIGGISTTEQIPVSDGIRIIFFCISAYFLFMYIRTRRSVNSQHRTDCYNITQ